MPAKGAAKRHPPAVQRAIVPAASDHSAVGAAPTSQHCPTAGAKGGLFCGPASTTGWTSASSRVSASLCVTSFCACAAASRGSWKRAVVGRSVIGAFLSGHRDNQRRRQREIAPLADGERRARRKRRKRRRIEGKRCPAARKSAVKG